jgi:hypothetical protein
MKNNSQNSVCGMVNRRRRRRDAMHCVSTGADAGALSLPHAIRGIPTITANITAKNHHHHG